MRVNRKKREMCLTQIFALYDPQCTKSAKASAVRHIQGKCQWFQRLSYFHRSVEAQCLKESRPLGVNSVSPSPCLLICQPHHSDFLSPPLWFPDFLLYFFSPRQLLIDCACVCPHAHSWEWCNCNVIGIFTNCWLYYFVCTVNVSK